VQNQRQTIKLLVSEKMSLTVSLERLSNVSDTASKLEALLQDEQAASERYRLRIHHLENETQQRSATIEELSRRERGLEEKCREQERELQLNRNFAEGLKLEVEQSQVLIRELQERIQSDDRVGELEASLQNVQDRASELEFQLSKSKQVNVSLKAERDKAEAALKDQTTIAATLTTKVSELEGRSAAAQKQLGSLTAEYQTLRVDKTSLQSQIDDHLGTIVGLRKAADQSAATKETLERQLQSFQVQMHNALRRAEAAEHTQQDLQNEGSSLMRSLDEMRPKIVELTNMKLELGEKLNILEQAVRDRDGIIAQLEATLQATQDQTESLNAKLEDTETAREKDRSTAQETQDELQRGYAELETELSDALVSIRELELDRAGQRQLASKQVEELERITATSQSLEEDVASLRQEVEEQKLAEVEQQEFLERARTDIEVLRADLVDKVEKIEELSAELSTAAANTSSPSLDKEMMNALKQQHRLELSAAQSQIRSLQTSVFEAEARAHSFQRQLSQSEDQLAQLRALSSPSTIPPLPPQPLSSSSTSSSSPHATQLDHPPRPSSRARNHSDDLRRASLTQRRGSNNSGIPLGAAHPAFGTNLSPETRHKRKVSLGMLKARIDSEMAAAGSVPPSRVASPLHAEVAERRSPRIDPHATNSIQNSHKRPQFLDESHIFWCHSCRGELVVL
jgi:myosin protein heavy chain